MTLGEWLDKWLNLYMVGTIRDSTLKGYRNHVETYIKPNLGDKQIAFITTADVQRMYNKLKKQGRINANSSINITGNNAGILKIKRRKSL